MLLLASACHQEKASSGSEEGSQKQEEKEQEKGATEETKGVSAPQITVVNTCTMDVWLASQPNAGQPNLPAPIVKIAARGGTHSYTMPKSGWAGRFWPKTGCDATGENCSTGQAIPPCPTQGCQPPADTKIEFYFGPSGGSDRPYYDVSLVDGFSLAAKIVPSGSGGRCTPTSCALDLNHCPTAEKDAVGDLQLKDAAGHVVQCFAPCKKWTWPTPVGDGKTEADPTGQALCCPSPMTSEQCNAGIVKDTEYVKLVHQGCPSAYAFSYDDAGGSHDCDPGTTFTVTLCPGVPAQP
jgi:hypothetical protein